MTMDTTRDTMSSEHTTWYYINCIPDVWPCIPHAGRTYSCRTVMNIYIQTKLMTVLLSRAKQV